MIGLKTFKVFLVDIHSVILFHARLHSGDERLHCVLVVLILLNLLAKAFDIALVKSTSLGHPPSMCCMLVLFMTTRSVLTSVSL